MWPREEIQGKKKVLRNRYVLGDLRRLFALGFWARDNKKGEKTRAKKKKKPRRFSRREIFYTKKRFDMVGEWVSDVVLGEHRRDRGGGDLRPGSTKTKKNITTRKENH